MTEFNGSEWIDSAHVQEFIENSDNYILERKRQFKILRSFYQYFLKNKIKNRTTRILDLGCGDGRITQEILKLNSNAEVFLVDGSLKMLETAKSNFKEVNALHYIHKTFQDLLDSDTLTHGFDFIVSSLAIHHLSSDERESLFAYIYNHLRDGGYFLNMEVVLPRSKILEEWYLMLWKEWIQENEIKLCLEESFGYLPIQYKNNPDNHPDTLEKQLDALKTIGFKNIDCHYKYGIFTIYSGEK